MAGTILTGASGSGKTGAAIEAILATKEQDFWKETWVLLPTRLQSDAFRERLLQRAPHDALFNVRFFNFYELYEMLLNLAGTPQRTITGAAIGRILRYMINTLHSQGELTYYHRIADKPGFIKLVSGFIEELKQGVVLLEDFEKFAIDSQDARTRDLSRIYTAYQLFLQQNNLVDRDGAGWVALECLRKDTELVHNVDLLVVDGFDQFTPLQSALLAALSQSAQQTLLTLTHEEGREAHHAFRRTLQRLDDYGSWDRQALLAVPDRRAPELNHLESELFRLHVQSRPAGDALRLIEAPDPQAESRAVLREVKRRLLEGADPESLLIVMRDASSYAENLRRTGAAYGLPLAVRQAETLLENPAVNTILSLIDLHSHDFPRRTLLDVLRSPYLRPPDLSLTQIEALERLSMERPVVRGRENWLREVVVAPHSLDEEGEEPGFQPDDPEALHRSLSMLFERITPPPRASARKYVAWIEGLLGPDIMERAQDAADALESAPPLLAQDFQFYAGVREGVEGTIASRDLYALHGFWSVLRELLSAYDLQLELMRSDKATFETPWETFRQDLQYALQGRQTPDDGRRSRTGRVLVTTVYEARGLPHEEVFILGLSEGGFPARLNEDPLYSDRERAELEAAEIEVQTVEDRLREDALFYEMCGLARTRLTLSRSTVDEGGNLLMESPFWRMTEAILSGATRTRLSLGGTPPLEDSATFRELLVSLGSALGQSDEQVSPTAWGAVSWLRENPLWAGVRRGRQIELGREDRRLPFDAYSGVLSNPALIAQAARKIEERVWSATQFNDLGQCGFRFFSKRLLKLERYEEPEEGPDVMQLGSVYHKILEDTYRGIQAEGFEISRENGERALEILEDVARRVLKTAPQKFHFQPPPTWEQDQEDMLKRLRAVVSLDFTVASPIRKLAGNAPRVPFMLEAPFGEAGEDFLTLETSVGSLRARGYIDRIDVAGDAAYVIDYKSGSKTPTKPEMGQGLNFQMLLYLLAMDQYIQRHGLALRVGGGLFWSLKTNAEGGVTAPDDPEIQGALAHLERGVAEALQGFFPNKPGKAGDKCSHYCEFREFCRMNRASRDKLLPNTID